MTYVSPTKGFFFSQVTALGAAIFFIAYQKAAFNIGDALLSAFLMFVFALLFSIPFSLRAITQPRKSRYFTPKNIMILIIIILCALIGNALIAFSLSSLPPSTAHLMQRSETIFTILIGLLFLQEKGAYVLLIASAFFIVGLYILNIGEYETVSLNIMPLLASILAALIFAIMQALSRVLLTTISASLINGFRLFFVVIAMMVFFPNLLGKLYTLPQTAYVNCAIAALAGPVISRLSYMKAGQHLGVAKAALYTAISPFYTILIQWLFAGIVIQFNQLLGSSILIFAVSLPTLIKARKHLPKILRQHSKD